MVKKIICLLIIILLSEFIYLKTLLVGPGFHDVGELQTACCTLGIAHPPGYPTYVILGKIFSMLPISNIAWRINFMSAVFSILSLIIFFLICYKIYQSHLASLLATLILAFTKNFWEYSLISEMYSLNVFFILLSILYTIVIFSPKKAVSFRHFLLFFFVMGLAQGNHRGTTLITPLIFLFITINQKKIIFNLKRFFKLSLAFILGLSIYLFLPLRSMQNPYLNYAHPVTWNNFKYLVSAEQFHFLMFTVSIKTIFTEKIPWFYKFLNEQYFIFGLILATLGLFWLIVKKKIQFIILIILIFLINTAVWLAYNTDDINRYLTPSVVMIGFFVAGGIKVIFTFASHQKQWSLKTFSYCILSLPFLFFIVSLITTTYPKVDRSKDNASFDWGISVLKNLKPNAVIISHWGYSSSLWYLQGCEKIRPDVLIADERVILDEGWGSKIDVIKRFIKTRPVYIIVYKPFADEVKEAGYQYLDKYWFYEIYQP